MPLTPPLKPEDYPEGLWPIVRDASPDGGRPPVELVMMGRVPALSRDTLTNQRAHTKADDAVLDARTRVALTLAVSVANGCHGCAKTHHQHCLDAGWSAADITAIMGITAECAMLNAYHRHRAIDASLGLPESSGLTFSLLTDPPIDRRVCELIAVVVSGLHACATCVHHHTQQARSLGITEEQLREAVRIGSVMTMLNTYFRVQ